MDDQSQPGGNAKVKILKGQPVNITSPIMGRVSRSGRRLSLRKDAIYVSEEIRGHLWGYAGAVVGQSNLLGKLPKGKPSVLGLPTADLAFLQDGDVIVLEPSGQIKVVWDADSQHNAIFVTDSCNCR
jgi:hypothetical protein